MTTLSRRNAAILVAGLLAAGAVAGGTTALAQDYPSRPIRLVSATQPGSGGDIIARLIAEPLTKLLKHNVLVDNKPGADGIIASSHVATAKPDGYTLLLAYTGHVVNPGLRSNLPYDTLSDFTAISMVASNAAVLAVRVDHPAKSLRDLIDLARKKPGGLSFGYLPGSVTHVAGEQIVVDQRIEILRVPFKTNAAAITSIMVGDLDFAFSTLAPVQPQVTAGRLRLLAITEAKRSNLIPDVPTVAETIPGYQVIGWYGVLGPKALPTEVVRTLNGAIRKVLAEPELSTRLLRQGNVPAPSSPQEFSAFIAAEVPRWLDVTKRAGIKAE